MFYIRYRTFKSYIVPFSLTNKLTMFQQYINNILFNYLNNFCIAYLNNIIVYSKNKLEYTKYVRKVLLRLRVANLQAKIKKYKFSIKKTKFLSYIVSTKEGIGLDLVKVAIVAN